jgi:hypothetical protein
MKPHPLVALILAIGLIGCSAYELPIKVKQFLPISIIPETSVTLLLTIPDGMPPSEDLYLNL